jgi:hypothetical protein
MTTREKIIVGFMLLTVVYGVYAIFFESKAKTLETPAISATKELENLPKHPRRGFPKTINISFSKRKPNGSRTR